MSEGFKDAQGRFRPTGGGKKRGTAVVAASAAAVAVAWGPAMGGGVGAGGSSGAALSPGMHAKVLDAKRALSKGSSGKAWRQLGLRQRAKRTIRHVNCVAHSHGPVQAFFVVSPCRSLRRLLLPLAAANGDAVVLSVSWVRMPSVPDATRFRHLIDVHGSGDIEPLGMNELRQRGINFTGHHYDSDSHGTVVVVAEAEAMSGRPSAEMLEAVATVGVSLPAPKGERR